MHCAVRVDSLVIAEVVKRLALHREGVKGHSLRAISRDTGVNRETVRNIARGKYQQEPQQAVRCEVCKHKVVMPCRICPALAKRAESSTARAA